MAGKERAEVEKLLEGGEKEVVVVVDEEAKEDELVDVRQKELSVKVDKEQERK